MRFVTDEPDSEETSPIRGLTLRVLGAYVMMVALLNLWRIVSGTGSIAFLVAQVALLAVIGFSLQSRRGFARIGDWLPLIALPILYWGLPWSRFGGDERLYDGLVQGWDRAMFGTDPARTLAGVLPSRPLSEMLHLAYLLYYAIIYLPPLVLYAGAHRRGFHQTVFAFTLTMVAAFSAFSLFPVEGPRFAWPAPPGIPSGPFRSLTLLLLEQGSTRGTAFPSSHVAIALAQTLSSLRWRPGLGAGAAVATVLLAIGAVYGGFHYASDIVAGGVLGTGAWSVARWLEKQGTSAAARE